MRPELDPVRCGIFKRWFGNHMSDSKKDGEKMNIGEHKENTNFKVLVRVELPLCTPYCYKYGRKDCLCHGRKFDSRRRAPLHLTYQKRITDYLLGGPRIHYFCKIIILRCIYPKNHKLCNISSFGQFSLFYC
jgi:hypothetical protein